MYRRLFFLFPSSRQTREVVHELEELGIAERDIHAFAKDEQLLADLPKATKRQKSGADLQLENSLWRLDLILFFIASAGFVIALWNGSIGWAALALAAMAVTFGMGYLFATRIPKVHLTEFRDALKHHEILLSVDVPPRQVAAVERLVHAKHPEAVDGGVGWSLHRFDL